MGMKQFDVSSGNALFRDLVSGIVLGLLSVPLSLAYAHVAGLPVSFGLYGGAASILIFSLLTTSKRFFYGVEAAPAAMTAAMLPGLGIAAREIEAIQLIPMITLMAALWILLFFLLKGGRFAKFISEPVISGCISGIACIVILSELPMLFGGRPASGKLQVLIPHLLQELSTSFHPLSFILGAATFLPILYFRHRTRISMSVVALLSSMVLSFLFHPERYGVAMVGALSANFPGFPGVELPLVAHHWEAFLLETLAIALVITSETIVSTRMSAWHHDEKVDEQRELLAYGLANLAAAFCGCCPVCGSMSRSNRARKRGVSSQWSSLVAGIVLILFTLFGTPLLAYLPVPVLMGIMIGSLMTILEFPFALRLFKTDRVEAAVFAATFIAELFGMAEGVLVGVILSFGSIVYRTAYRPGHFLGVIEGRTGFFELKHTPEARPVKGTLLYQFNAPLFYASVDDFERDLEGEIREDTRLIIVTGLTSVDLFSAEWLEKYFRQLKEKGISLYLAGHASLVNEQLIEYGAEELIHQGAVIQRLTEALNMGGISEPYPLEERKGEVPAGDPSTELFNWTYGRYREKGKR